MNNFLEKLELQLKPADVANWEVAAKLKGCTVADLVAEATNEYVKSMQRKQRSARRATRVKKS